MAAPWRRRSRIKPGDGQPLRRLRWWQVTRIVFHLPLTGPSGQETWSVEVRSDDNGNTNAHLYLNGRHHAQSRVPAAFPVTGGTIEVATSGFGLKRCHYVTDDGAERQLVPDPASTSGRRQRMRHTHPVLDRAIGATSWLILVVALILGIPQLVQEISQIPPLAERFGTFQSPFALPAWFNTSLLLATLLASTERALRLRNHWLLDGGLFDGED